MNVKRILYVMIALILIFTLWPGETFASSKMPSGSKVADVIVEDKTTTEIKTMLGDEIIIWQAGDALQIEGEFETLTVSREVFSFNVDATLSELREKTKRKISTFFKRPKNVYIPLQVSIDEKHTDIEKIKEKSYIDYDAILKSLENIAKDLSEGTISLPIIEGEEIPLETIAEVELEKPKLSKATIDYVIDELDGTLIESESLFSFLETIDTSDQLLNSRDESSFLGTGLYALFLQAEFDIVSRHPQLTLPSYGDKGLNAEVNQKENKDLIVMNKSDATYRLKVEQKKKKVIFVLEGNEPQYTYEVATDNEKEIEPRTIYRYSKKIKPSEHQVIQAGENGLALDVIRSQFDNGTYVKESIVSKDLYLPSPRILLVSPEELDEVEEENLEIALDDEEILFDEEMTVDRQGNLIRPDGTSGGSIFDILPEELEGSDIYDEIKEVDEAQQQYEEFLDKLLDIYAKNTTDINEENLAKIQETMEKMIELEEQLAVLINELIDQELIDKDFLDKKKGGQDK